MTYKAFCDLSPRPLASSLSSPLLLICPLLHEPPCCSLNHLRPFASAVSSAQCVLPVICGATSLPSFKSLLKHDLVSGFLPCPIYLRLQLPSQALISHLDLLSTYCFLTHWSYLSCLQSGSPLQSTFHKGRDFCLWFSLLYPQHPEQCRPHGRIQYLLNESMASCFKARRLHREAMHRQETMYWDRKRQRERGDADDFLKAFQFPLPISNEHPVHGVSL